MRTSKMQAAEAHSTLKTYIFSNARMLKARYAELAYCRMKLQRARAMGDKRGERFYQQDAEQARRCVEALLHPKRKAGVVVYPGIRAEVELWVRLSLSRPDAVVDARTKRDVSPGTGGHLAPVHCARCESIGHEVDTCPFDASDARALRVAQQRRAKRRVEP